MARKNSKVRERKMPKAAQPKKGQRRPHRKEVEPEPRRENPDFIWLWEGQSPRQ